MANFLGAQDPSRPGVWAMAKVWDWETYNGVQPCYARCRHCDLRFWVWIGHKPDTYNLQEVAALISQNISGWCCPEPDEPHVDRNNWDALLG